jgi:hypothetical protein
MVFCLTSDPGFNKKKVAVMNKVCAILILLLLGGTVFAAEKALTSFPKRTSLVAKIDSAAIKKIDFVNKMLNDGENLQLADARSAVESYLGLDLYKIDTLWAAVGESEEFLAIAKGKFDSLPVEKALRKLSNFGEIRVDGVHFAAVFPDDKNPNKNNVLAVINENTVMLGEEKFAKEFLEVYAGKKKGLDAGMQRRVSLMGKSKNLVHAMTMNFVLPAKERDNPILKNLKKAELVLDSNSKYFNLRIDADAHDTTNLPGIAQILSGALNAQKNSPNVKDNAIVADILKNAKLSSNSKGLALETKLSRSLLKTFLEDQLFGLEKVFE